MAELEELLSDAEATYGKQVGSRLRTIRHAGIEVMPHQLEPALAVLRGLGCRVLLADEVGLGKTIQAAIAIARAAGAEIFATAGSEERRQLLRDWGIEHVYDSRSIAFGCVESYDIPEGDPPITLTAEGPPVTTSARFTANTLLVIARDGTLAGTPTPYPLPDVPPSATPGRSALTYLNVYRQAATDPANLYLVTDVNDIGGSAASVPFGTWSAPREPPACG